MYHSLLSIFIDFPNHWDNEKYPLSETDRAESAKSLYAEVLMYYFIQLCLKCSVLALYWRLFSMSKIRNLIIFTFVVVLLWFVIVVRTPLVGHISL
jgi:hypothetical protein